MLTPQQIKSNIAEAVDSVPGSDYAKTRFKVLLEYLSNVKSAAEAGRELDLSEAEFEQFAKEKCQALLDATDAVFDQPPPPGHFDGLRPQGDNQPRLSL
jgi:hypothetical protein